MKKGGRTIFSLFYHDFDSELFWQETNDSADLNKISNDVAKRFPNSGFKATYALVLTMVNIKQYEVPFSRNTMQQVLATDGTKLYGILNIYRADSTHLASSGYYDQYCKKGRTFRTYTDTEIEMHRDEINPYVVPLINNDCSIPGKQNKCLQCFQMYG